MANLTNIFRLPHLTTSLQRLLITGSTRLVHKSNEPDPLPDKPKRPLSAYFRFIQERRPLIKQESPDLKVTEITRRAAEEWKNLDASSKDRYQTAAKAAFEQYTNEYLRYDRNLTEKQREAIRELKDERSRMRKKRAKAKLIKDNDKPKKPMGAYFMFIRDRKKSFPEKNYQELLKESKEMWLNLSEDEKKKYFNEFEGAARQYEEELARWEKRMIGEGKSELVRVGTRKDNQRPKKN